MSLILKPRITEKTLIEASRGVYVFDTPMTANKIEIARAVKSQFKVDAIDVRIVVSKGKIKRFKQVKGRRVDTKKAYIQVAAGQKIAAFDMGQEEVAEPKKTKKKDSQKAGAK